MRDIHPSRVHQVNNIVKLNLIGMPYNFKKLLKNDTFCGHINYCPPELLDDDKSCFSEKTDIWGLGCTLYYLHRKKDPFEGSNVEEIKMNIQCLKIDENVMMNRNNAS